LKLIAETAFDLADTPGSMGVRLYAPERDPEHGSWHCTFEVDAPVSVTRKIYGATSLQALLLALKTLSAYLYGSDAYKQKEFGVDGDFGGDLFFPATHLFLDTAPYPF
jgi:hypothetical protein